jgi:hypothetical protein
MLHYRVLITAMEFQWIILIYKPAAHKFINKANVALGPEKFENLCW